MSSILNEKCRVCGEFLGDHLNSIGECLAKGFPDLEEPLTESVMDKLQGYGIVTGMSQPDGVGALLQIHLSNGETVPARSLHQAHMLILLAYCYEGATPAQGEPEDVPTETETVEVRSSELPGKDTKDTPRRRSRNS